MKRHRLCKATTVVNGHLLRCQMPANHFSTHYCDHYWWANDKGLPMKCQREARTSFMSFWRRLFK